MKRTRTSQNSNSRLKRRCGSILLVVLVIVVMLSLGAYTFTQLMVADVEATSMHGRGVQTRAFADSGIELVAALLGNQEEFADVNYYHEPELFQHVLLRDATRIRGRGRFSIIAPVENDPNAGTVRFGLIDESGKLNPSGLLSLELDEEQARTALMYLPEMTEDIADAILDWVDEDDTERRFGAESEYYENLPTPYPAKNGPLESLDELLLVREVTPWLLFGEDANRNGLLDPNENDGEASLPYDNADGVLQLGWSAYLTNYSREANRRTDGTERISLNQNALTELFDQLEEEFDEEVALFVTAYRINGSNAPDTQDANSSGLSGSSSSGGGSRNSQGDDQQALQQLAQSVARAAASGGGSVTRGGLDLSQGGQVQINSIYDLVDVQVDATIDNSQKTLDSPWTSDARDMQQYLPDLIDKLSTTSDEIIQGRININQARFETLAGLPGMTEELANSIVDAKMIGSGGEPLTDTIAARSTTGWLLMEGLVDLQQMRELDRYLTTRGDVYRVQSLGYFDAGGPITRLEAVIDGTKNPPKIVFLRDLTELGRGYSPRQFAPAD